MMYKLKAIVLDDDQFALELLKDMCLNSEYLEIVGTFSDPKDFMEKVPLVKFDIALLDISMPGMDGLLVAQLLNGKPFIFITAAENRLKDALKLEPIDIITKPYLKERLDHAFQKAFKLLGEKKREYAVFNIAEKNRKVTLFLPDILFVAPDDIDPRNKLVTMRSGEQYTIMDCKLDDLLGISPWLVQVNRSELVALDAIAEVEHDSITVKGLVKDGRDMQVTLTRSFKEILRKKMFLR